MQVQCSNCPVTLPPGIRNSVLILKIKRLAWTYLPELSSFTSEDIALVTLSAAISKSSLKFLPAERSPNACLMSPSTPLNGACAGLEFSVGSAFTGATGGFPKMSLEGESSILCALGLLGVRGDPACERRRKLFRCRGVIRHLIAQSTT